MRWGIIWERRPPVVTWQFTEGKKGQRDYYWSRYGNSLEWTQRDFNHRVGDFSTFTMGQSKIQSWDRRALTATIPHGTLWI